MEKSRNTPLYVQIQEYLLNLIETGALQPGDKLPSENTLAKQFETTRATVVNGFQPLVHAGRIVREPGRGSFVARRSIDAPLVAANIQSLEEQLSQQGARISYRLLRFDLVVPEARVLEAFGEPEGAEMYQLKRVRLADGRPISLEIRHFTRSLGRKMTVSALEELAFIDILQDELGLQVGKIEGSVSAIAASEAQAAMLSSVPGAPLVIRDYVFFDEAGGAVSHGVSYYLSEIKFHYSIQR